MGRAGPRQGGGGAWHLHPGVRLVSDKARRGIPKLLQLGVTLDSTPPFLQEMLTAHSQRFLRYTPL